MSVAYVSGSADTAGFSVSTITVAAPAGISAGNLLVAFVAWGVDLGAGEHLTSVPSGFTEVPGSAVNESGSASRMAGAVYVKVATASEPASYTWNWSTTISRVAVAIECYSGVATADGASAAASSGVSTPASTPAFAAVGATSTLVAAFTARLTGTTFTTPSGTTARDSATGHASIATFDEALSSSSAPSLSSTLSGSDYWVALAVALTPRPAFVSGSTAESGSGSTCTVTAPSGIVAGNLLLALIGTTHGSVTPPSGWTAVRASGLGGVGFAIFYKVATGSEPANYAFTANAFTSGAVLQYSAVGSTPIDVYAVSDSQSGSSASAPAVTTVRDGDAIVSAVYDFNALAWSTPSGMTQRAALNAAGNDSIYVWDAPQSAHGADGPFASTAGGFGDMATVTVALRPAAQPPPQPPPHPLAKRVVTGVASVLSAAVR